ncbi:hypothetical protein Tsubulata_022037, partial [Turnera subulata]
MSSQSQKQQKQQRKQQQKQSAKPVEEMMRNLKVEPSLELADSNMVQSKEGGSPSDAISCISSSAGDATSSIRETEVDHDSLGADQAMPAYAMGGYYGYYYPGYDASFGGVDDKGYYVPADGSELQYPVVQADNGSLIYFMPEIHPAYNPYSQYLPVSTISLDGQYAGQPPFSPGPIYQPSILSPGYIPAPIPYGEMVPSPYLLDPLVFNGDGGYGNVYSTLEIPGSKPSMSSPGHGRGGPRSDLNGPPEGKASIPDVPTGHGVRHRINSGTKADVLGNAYVQYAKYPSYNQGKGGMIYPSSPGKSRVWASTEKSRTRNKLNSVGDIDANDHSHAPRTTSVKGALTYGGPAGSLTTDGNVNDYNVAPIINRDQYNLPDFPTKYDHAFFFVIKSYSEDDIHKSIKYNVWASTPNGNRRLDSAYQDAQQKIAEKNSNCPVFLFFSVNASGQFCGVAEMAGRVDFNKNMDFWQQDKWNGYFPVKWHIIKDVPNPQLRHIILENNENKPVTNSRDTQEVPFPQGVEMLNIFKNYGSKTSILDDFDFYESRQKVLQEKRPRPLIPQFDLKQ